MRKLTTLLAVNAALMAAVPAHAITFTYSWVGTGSTGGGTVGSGSMTFSAASVSDPANFSALSLASSLTALTYTWDNGSTTRTISYTGGAIAGLFSSNTIAAINGVLSNPTTISDFPTNSFALTLAPSTSTAVGISENSSVGSLVDRDQGAWRLAAVVPEPGTWAMMLAGISGILMLARRRQRS